jgi:predicted MFS family arabinose efflux permease
MLGVGTMQFGVFFFLTLFTQEIWHYSPLRAGVAFLPLAGTVLVGAAAASALVPRTGPRPLLLAGAAACAGGMAWLSLLPVSVSYAAGLLGPGLIIGIGLGLLFVPAPLVALAGVADADTGVAASLLNASRQVGGAIGLALLSTVAWTVTGHAAGRAGFTSALAAGCDRAFAVAAAVAVLALLVALVTIKGGRRAGADIAPPP